MPKMTFMVLAAPCLQRTFSATACSRPRCMTPHLPCMTLTRSACAIHNSCWKISTATSTTIARKLLLILAQPSGARHCAGRALLLTPSK